MKYDLKETFIGMKCGYCFATKEQIGDEPEVIDKEVICYVRDIDIHLRDNVSFPNLEIKFLIEPIDKTELDEDERIDLIQCGVEFNQLIFYRE